MAIVLIVRSEKPDAFSILEEIASKASFRSGDTIRTEKIDLNGNLRLIFSTENPRSWSVSFARELALDQGFRIVNVDSATTNPAT